MYHALSASGDDPRWEMEAWQEWREAQFAVRATEDRHEVEGRHDAQMQAAPTMWCAQPASRQASARADPGQPTELWVKERVPTDQFWGITKPKQLASEQVSDTKVDDSDPTGPEQRHARLWLPRTEKSDTQRVAAAQPKRAPARSLHGPSWYTSLTRGARPSKIHVCVSSFTATANRSD